MLTKSSLVIAACAASLGWSVVGLSADTATLSVVSPRCADGSCVPRRLTNGYYPTTWRRWPIDPPARDKPGVREGISAPSMELPSPSMETYLPEGVLMAPPPTDAGGADGGFDTGPRDSIRGAPPSGPATPRGGSPEGVPPELRSEPTRAPTNRPLPNRQRAVAGRSNNRPAAVIEALRSEAAVYPSAANNPDAASNAPAALPKDEGNAQPLSPPPAVETPSARPVTRWAPTSQSLHLDYEQADRAGHASDRPGRTNWSPTRTTVDDVAPPKSTASKPDAGGRFALPEQAASRQVTSGPNAPAAIYARTLVGDGRRSVSRADFTISAAQSPAVLSVRTVSDEGWNPNSQFRNPLRGAPAVTKVAFEMSDPSSEEVAADSVSQVENPLTSAELEAPDNPLR